MDEEEIEIWYDSEKEILFEKYKTSLDTGADRGIAEKEFTVAMSKLKGKYSTRYDGLKKKKEFREKLEPIKQSPKKLMNYLKKAIRFKK